MNKPSWFNHILSINREYKPRNYLKIVSFTLLIVNRGTWKCFRLETILNNFDMKKASWFNHILSFDKQYKLRNYLKIVSFTLLNMNRGNWKWFRLETILNNIDMNKASWFNHILSINREYKPRNYVKIVSFTLLIVNRGTWKCFRLETILNNFDMKKASWFNHILSFDKQYKPRNYLKIFSFTLLNMNRGNWKWFRLETILNNIDMNKASWFNHIKSFDKEYKHRNYLKIVSFTLLLMNRGNWKWFRLETILNNIDMKKASWFNHILSINRDYKPRNYLKIVSFTLLIMNSCTWKCFRLETILNHFYMKKASWFNHILSFDKQYKPRNYLKIVSFTLLLMNRGNWKWFRLETILNNIDMNKASWFNHILSFDKQYKLRNYLKIVSFTLLNMNRGNWKWFRLETILNNIDMNKASWFNHILSINREYKPRNYVKIVSFTLLIVNRGTWKCFRLETILNNFDMKKASWFNHILSFDKQYKPRNYLKIFSFTLLNMNRGNWKWFRLETILNNIDMNKASWFNHILSFDKQYKPRNYLKIFSFTLLNMNRGNWKWFRLETILNNIDMNKASWFNHILSFDKQYKLRNYLKIVSFTLLNMNRGNWKWFRLETILNNIDMNKASWFNHILSINREYKPRNYVKIVSFTLLIVNRGTWKCFRLETILNNFDMNKASWFNHILSINREYKPRNYVKIVSFTLLIVNRGTWKCFRLETILNNFDMKKASWFNHILSFDKQYKPRNYLKIFSFTLLNMNRGNWKWFRLETILNNIDMNKASWFNHILSFDKQYKPRNYLKIFSFTLLNMNRGNWKWFRLETILNNIDMNKASWFNHILSFDKQYKLRNYLKIVSFTLLNMNRGNWKWFRLETILNNIDMNKASWFNHILSINREYKPRNYVKIVSFTLLIVNRGTWKCFRLETILNNFDMKKASWFNHILSFDKQYKPRNYLKIFSFTLLNMNRGNWKWFRLETILNNIDMNKASWFNHIKSFDKEYKHRNYLKIVSFTLLLMNRGNWKWFRLETILNNIDMKKASWFNHILSINRDYKPRNYLKIVSFTLLIMNSCTWKCFRLETILNHFYMKKASWFNHIKSFDKEYKHRNYLKIVSFTLLLMNRGNWKWFRLETILNNIDMKKASWFNHILSINRDYKPRNYLKIVSFTLLIMNSCTWKCFRLETILNHFYMKKASWFNHILSFDKQYKPRNYLKIVSFTLLLMNRGNWKWFRLETILNNIDMNKASWFNHILSFDKEYKHMNYLKIVSFTLLLMNRGNWKSFRLETILNNIDMKKHRDLTIF